jgi:hypothetical protein
MTLKAVLWLDSRQSLEKGSTMKAIVCCIPTITLDQPSRGLDNKLVCTNTISWFMFIPRQGSLLAGNRLLGHNTRRSGSSSGHLASKIKWVLIPPLSFEVDLNLMGITRGCLSTIFPFWSRTFWGVIWVVAHPACWHIIYGANVEVLSEHQISSGSSRLSQNCNRAQPSCADTNQRDQVYLYKAYTQCS